MKAAVLPQEFYFQKTKKVSRELLGKVLCHRGKDGVVRRGKIVETEAYLGVEDPAAHTFGDRRTNRTQSMYLDGGHSYVYLIYGMYNCLNIVTRTSDHPEAVLIRALEPCDFQWEEGKKIPRSKIPTNGPGKLCRYLELTREHDGLALWTTRSGLWVEDAPVLPASRIVTTTRIGVEYAGEASDWPLRFYIRDNPFVSKK